MATTVRVSETDRVIGRVSPKPADSPRGYLRRVAAYWCYTDPMHLIRLARIMESDLDRADSSDQIAYALRIGTDEWRTIAYRRSGEDGPPRSIQFGEEWIGYGQLTFANPRICLRCIQQNGIENRLWELRLFVCCPRHHCMLVDFCPACDKRIPRRRAKVRMCSCGHDICDSEPMPSDAKLTALSRLIEHASSQVSPDETSTSITFPAELSRLKLGALLYLVQFIGNLDFGVDARRDRTRPHGSNLNESVRIARQAATLLAQWPDNFVSFLQDRISQFPVADYRVSLLTVFGRFYQRLFVERNGYDFSFLRHPFQQAILKSWQGPISALQNWMTPEILQEYGWCTAEQVRQSEHISSPEKLMRQGELEGFFARSSGTGKRRVCWIKRESLVNWRKRQAELIGLRDLSRVLGLSWKTVFNLADEGLFRRAPSRTRHMFEREEVTALIQSFARSGSQEWNSWDESTCITLQEALKTTLSKPSRLALVLKAILAGTLSPVGHSRRHPGVTGYVFRIREILTIRHSADPYLDTRFLNASDIARLGLMSREKLLALIRSGFLTALAGC